MKLVDSERIENVRSKKVAHKQITSHIKNKLSFKMAEFCKENGGTGLAAPQIGLMERFFVATIKGRWGVYFNPQVVVFDNANIEIEEGCLSYPGLTVRLERSPKITVRYYSGPKPVTETLKGLDAVIFQHEVDHLDGITISTLLAEGVAKEVKKEKKE